MDALSYAANALQVVLGNGTGTLQPYAEAMAFGFMALGGVWAFGNMALSGGASIAMPMRLLITGLFYLIVVQAAQPIGEKILTGAVQFGLAAGGASINAGQFLNSPDSIFTTGYRIAIDLQEIADASCGSIMTGGCMMHLQTYVPVIIAAWTVFIAFAILAIMVLLTFALFKFTLLAALVILPAAAFAPAAGFATGPVRYAVTSAVQLMTLAMIVAVARTSIGYMTVHADDVPGINLGGPFILAGLFLMALTLGSMVIANSLTSGTASAISSFVTGPAMAAGAARSAAGHLDAPATAAARMAGGATYKAMSAGVNVGRNALASLRAGSAASKG